MRIAVLLCDFPLQAYLRDLLACWTGAGHQVVLLKTSRHVDTADGEMAPFRVETLPTGLFQRALNVVDRMLHRCHVPSGLSTRAFARWAGNRLAGKRPDLLIGVEKKGLIAADWLSGQTGVPFAYYSLELYIEGHPAERDFAHLRRNEIASNKRAIATIIQDERRAEVLARANGLQGHRFVHLPIGAMPAKLPPGPDSGQRRQDRVFTALYFGVLHERRRLTEMLDAASRLGPEFLIHVHGPSAPEQLALPGHQSLKFTSKLLDEAQLDALVAGADVGIALYHSDPINERLTAFSSHKIAMYLKHGKPIVLASNESSADLLGRFECGVMIERGQELSAAIMDIQSNYRRYQEQAVAAFRAYFDISRGAPGVLEKLVTTLEWPEVDHGPGASKTSGRSRNDRR